MRAIVLDAQGTNDLEIFSFLIPNRWNLKMLGVLAVLSYCFIMHARNKRASNIQGLGRPDAVVNMIISRLRLTNMHTSQLHSPKQFYRQTFFSHDSVVKWYLYKNMGVIVLMLKEFTYNIIKVFIIWLSSSRERAWGCSFEMQVCILIYNELREVLFRSAELVRCRFNSWFGGRKV